MRLPGAVHQGFSARIGTIFAAGDRYDTGQPSTVVIVRRYGPSGPVLR